MSNADVIEKSFLIIATQHSTLFLSTSNVSPLINPHYINRSKLSYSFSFDLSSGFSSTDKSCQRNVPKKAGYSRFYNEERQALLQECLLDSIKRVKGKKKVKM